MPFHRIRHRYPPYWHQLAHWVKFVRQRGLCQHCGARHGEQWVRRRRDGHMFRTALLAEIASKHAGIFEVDALLNDIYAGYSDQYAGTTIILACCHADHGHHNHHPSNLLALCQYCHLDHDRRDNRRRFRQNFNRKRGQLPLFTTIDT